jgi:hypothetical protein
MVCSSTKPRRAANREAREAGGQKEDPMPASPRPRKEDNPELQEAFEHALDGLEELLEVMPDGDEYHGPLLTVRRVLLRRLNRGPLTAVPRR